MSLFITPGVSALSGGIPAAATRTVMFVGDSFLAGDSNPLGEWPGARGEFFREAAREGYDVRAMGTRLTSFIPSPTYQTAKRYGTGSPRSECLGGSTIADHQADFNANFAQEYARSGVLPDVVFVLLGANAGGETDAQILARLKAFVSQVRTNVGRACWIVVCSYPYPYGFNSDIANSVVAPLVAAGDARVLFEDLFTLEFTGFDRGQIGAVVNSDVHPNNRGEHAIGSRLFARFRALFPLPTGDRSPRSFAPMQPQSSWQANALPQVISINNPAFGQAGPTRILVGITVAPNVVSPGVLQAICGYNIGVDPGWSIAVENDAYGTSVSLRTGGGFGALRFTAKSVMPPGGNGQWVRLWVSYDETIQLWSVWGTPAGEPVLLGYFEENFVQLAGKLFTVGGFGQLQLGNYQNLQLCAGAALNVPKFDELLPHLRRDYFEHISLPGVVGGYPIDEGAGFNIIDWTGTANGVATAGSAWSTVPAPWE